MKKEKIPFPSVLKSRVCWPQGHCFSGPFLTLSCSPLCSWSLTSKGFGSKAPPVKLASCWAQSVESMVTNWRAKEREQLEYFPLSSLYCSWYLGQQLTLFCDSRSLGQACIVLVLPLGSTSTISSVFITMLLITQCPLVGF